MPAPVLDEYRQNNSAQNNERHVVVSGNGIASIYLPALANITFTRVPTSPPVTFGSFEFGGATYSPRDTTDIEREKLYEQAMTILRQSDSLLSSFISWYLCLLVSEVPAPLVESPKPTSSSNTTLPSFSKYTKAEAGLIDRSLHENRHASDKHQHEYDKQHGLTVYKKK